MKKKLIAVFMIAVIMCLGLTGCGSSSTNAKEKFGIITSSPEQAEQIKKLMNVEDKKELSELTFYLGTMKGQNVVLVKNEIGKVNAALATQILLDKYGATKIIETGCFTALKDEFKDGDVVVGNETVQYDFDATGAGYAKAEIPATGLGAFATDVDMHEKALEYAEKVEGAEGIKEVRICTGDKYELTKEEIDQLVKDHDGDCYDMDSAAVGQVCYLNGTPYIIVGCISSPDAPSEVPAKLVEKIVGAE